MAFSGGSGGGGAGQFGDAYVPPPPPPARGRSPWMYIGIGCGALLLISFAGCIGGGLFLGNKMKQAMNQPVDKAKLERDLADVPKYPGSKLNEKATQAAGAAMGIMTWALKNGQKMTFASYDTPDDESKILAWYDKTMPAKGFKSYSGKQSAGMNTNGTSHMYQKGDVIAMVQIPNNSQSGSFMLVRMQGLQGKDAANVHVTVGDDKEDQADKEK